MKKIILCLSFAIFSAFSLFAVDAATVEKAVRNFMLDKNATAVEVKLIGKDETGFIIVPKAKINYMGAGGGEILLDTGSMKTFEPIAINYANGVLYIESKIE